jgi:putative endonuclease
VSDDRRVQLGRTGEDLACEELRRIGYAILERRFRTRYGEIDVIARDGNALVFVEVKLRDGTSFGLPKEAVNRMKQRRMALVALAYLAQRRIRPCSCRFDVVSVLMGDNTPRVDVIRGAFDLTAGTF